IKAEELAGAIAVPRLAIAWQMLLKGLDEGARAPRPFAAAEMLLIRMCYTAKLPSPADIIGSLAGRTVPQREAAKGDPSLRTKEAATAAPASVTQESAPSGAKPKPQHFGSFDDVVAYAGQIRDIKLKIALEEHASLVKFGPGFIELHLLDGAPQNLAQDLSRKMQSWTGERWIVSLSEERGLDPLGASRRAEEAQAVEDIRRHPVVKSVMHHFPDAEIKSVRALD